MTFSSGGRFARAIDARAKTSRNVPPSVCVLVSAGSENERERMNGNAGSRPGCKRPRVLT